MWFSSRHNQDAVADDLRLNAVTFSPSMNRTGRLIRCRCGATTPEIAVLVMAVVAAVIPAFGLLGQYAAHTYSNVGASLDHTAGSSDLTARAVEVDRPLAAAPGCLVLWSQWISLPSLIAVALGVAWLVLRGKSPRSPANPRRLAEALGDATCTAVAKRQRIVKRLDDDTSILLQGDLEVCHLMTDHPVTIRPNTSVQRACGMMEEKSLDYLLVCDENDTLWGLVSHYHLKRSKAKAVVDAMLPNPLFVSPKATLSATVTQMLNEGVSCVAVIDQDRAIGILTTKDIQLTLQAILQVLAKVTCEKRLVSRLTV
jgi:CBS domain-containing protein